jgi:hypothetical protein
MAAVAPKDPLRHLLDRASDKCTITSRCGAKVFTLCGTSSKKAQLMDAFAKARNCQLSQFDLKSDLQIELRVYVVGPTDEKGAGRTLAQLVDALYAKDSPVRNVQCETAVNVSTLNFVCSSAGISESVFVFGSGVGWRFYERSTVFTLESLWAAL